MAVPVQKVPREPTIMMLWRGPSSAGAPPTIAVAGSQSESQTMMAARARMAA
jgi:DsbC/DsbD-like thiol-disulfide interchange protein